MKKINWADADWLSGVVASSVSINAALRQIGLRVVGSNHNTFKKWVKVHNISIDHFETNTSAVMAANVARRKSYDQVVCECSLVSQKCLRTFVLREQLLNYVCAECGIADSWNGKPLVLQLDHLNGIHNDNRIDNLRWLCPNCHTQTTTFAGRNNLK